MTDDSFLNNDYSHINTKYNAKRIEQCYESYWYSINCVYISCLWVQADCCPSSIKEESEYVNILDIINTLVLVELYSIYEHI